MAPACARWLWAVAMTAALVAHAEDPAQRRAREELERQLQQLVGTAQPARVRVEFQALDEPNYTLDDAAFEIDGRALARPALEQLARDGVHPVWSGEVPPGRHLVSARLAYTNQTSVVVSDEGGYTWKVTGTNTFEVQAGLEVRVTVTPQRDGAQKDIARRMTVRLPATPVMLGEVDDGKMPEPVARKTPPAEPNAPSPPPPSLGVDDAKPAAAAQAPPRSPPPPERRGIPAEVPPPARDVTARRPERPQGTDALPASPEAEAAPAAQPPSLDAPPAAPVALPPAAAAPASEETEVPWAAVALGVVAAVTLLVVLARRRARPPTLEE
jgi:hypothetical protein